MAQQVSDIVWRVRQLIHDSAGSRWDDTEMMHWLNDGLLELVLAKPTANTVRVSIPLDSGTIQQLPDGAVQLMRITHNTASAKPTRLIDQDRMDAADPTWRAIAETMDVDHYLYDKEIPMEFQVYPPNTGAGSVEAAVSMIPTKLESMVDNVPVSDLYIPAMVDYLLYRAYSKHSKFAGNEQRAQNAYARFHQALGIRQQNETAADPHQTNKNPQTGVE